jgi:pyridoxal phosphate enzyme (YggS family)
MNDLIDNINNIKNNISRAALKSGKRPEDIQVVSVTKKVDSEAIINLLNLGMNNIGENRVQELLKKYDEVQNHIDKSKNTDGCTPTWHLIGHLQTNKVKYIVDKVDLIHSVDSIKLASVINEKCKEIDKVMNVLVQVNVSGEESKYGIDAHKLDDLLYEISKLPNIKVQGLMTMAPLLDDPETARPVFRELNKLFVDIRDKKYDNVSMLYLSMGMTNDYDIAIEEGANIVRIGTAIFRNN